MTAYHGGKSRSGKFIVKKILELASRYSAVGYCEPFCGMNGVYYRVRKKLDVRTFLAGDDNKSLIMMWKNAHRIKPKDVLDIKEGQFLAMSRDGKSSAKKGFIGHAYGFGGIYFGCFRPKYNPDVSRRLILNSLNRVKRMQKELMGVKFTHGNYKQFSTLKKFIIYCDPPYRVPHTRYYNECHQKKKFNHTVFWDWVRKMGEHNLVLVSEYSAPKDFVSLSDFETYTSYGNGQKRSSEKLFIQRCFLP